MLNNFIDTISRKSIGRTLGFYILSISVLVTILSASFQLYLEYSHDRKEIDNSISEIHHSLEGLIIESLWITNEKMLSTIIQGLLTIPYFEKVEFQRPDGTVLTKGKIFAKRVLIHEHNIEKHYKGKAVKLGHIKISANLDLVWDKVIGRSMIIIGTQAIWSILLAFSAVGLFYWVVGRHLIKMSEYSKSISIDSLDAPLILNRRPVQGAILDEVDLLSTAINDMRKKLSNSIESLKDRDEQYRAVVDNVGDYIMRYDEEHRHIYVNRLALEATGLPIEEYIGKTHRELGFPDHLCDTWAKNIQYVFDSGKQQRIEFDVELAEGQMSLDLLLTPEFASDGSIKSVIGISRDVTERKQIEAERRRNEKDLKESQRIAHLGSWRLDLETNEVFWTEELYKMYGFDPMLPPPPYTEHMKLFTPKSWGLLSSSLEKTSETGIPYELELEMIREDESRGWIWVRGEAVKDSADNTIGLWGAAQDITERKRNEEKLTLQGGIITRMSEGVSLVNADSKIVYSNPAFENMFGYDSGEMIGLHVSSLNAPTDKKPEEAAEEILKAMKNKGSWIGEIQNIKKDGTFFWSSANVTILEHPKYGKAFISVQTDISELRQTQIDKKRLESKLQQAQKMESIGNLAGGIAHDFNNLLYPIIGYAEMLKEDLPKDSHEHESAQEIFNAGKRGGELVQQILAFSRQSDHKLQPVRIQKILKEVLKLTRSSIPSDIEMHQDIQKDCGSVMAEATQLHQIFMNLITNAYHAVEESSGIISVQLKEIKMGAGELKDSPLKPGQYVMLSVSDNGCGIPRNVINNIFEPYFTTKEKGKGTGLGLAVVYGILKKHNGDIKVYSKEGKGTTFNVYLPLIKKSTKAVAADSVSVLPTGVESLLLVDDEKSVVRLEKQMLERLGYNVVAQSSSIDALEIFKANPDGYDLVITDMTMPGMTGDKLAEEILSIQSDMPVIICTGFSERINKERAETIGVKGFLMKPVVKSEMAHMVRNVLDEAKV